MGTSGFQASPVKSEAKFEILNALNEAYFAGASGQVVQELRQQLSEKHGLSVPQVAAVGAWPLIKASQIIKGANLGDEIAPQQLVVVQFYFSKLGATPTLQDSQEIIELLGISNIDPQKVIELSSSLTELLNQKKRLSPNQSTRSLIAVSAKKDSALTNFDFPAKNRWRELWVEYVDTHLPYKNRSEARVLCLPGLECEREIGMYTRLGIKPWNIVAVESSKGIWPEFSARVHKLGATPLFGDLHDLAPTLKEPFHVVALDFLGQISFKSVAIIRNIPTFDRTIFMANHRCAREKTDIQFQLLGEDLLQHQADTIVRSVAQNILRGQGLANSFSGAVKDAFDGLRRDFDAGESRTISAVRDETFTATMAHNLGRSRPENHLYSDLVSQMWSAPRGPGGERIPRSLSSDLFCMEIYLSTVISGAQDRFRLPVEVNWIGDFVSDVIVQTPYARNIKVYKYQTEANSAHHYLSQFMVVDRPSSWYERWKSTAKPLVDLFLDRMKTIPKDSNEESYPDRLSFDVVSSSKPPRITIKKNIITVKTAPVESLIISRDAQDFRIEIAPTVQHILEHKAWRSRYADGKSVRYPQSKMIYG